MALVWRIVILTDRCLVRVIKFLTPRTEKAVKLGSISDTNPLAGNGKKIVSVEERKLRRRRDCEISMILVGREGRGRGK